MTKVAVSGPTDASRMEVNGPAFIIRRRWAMTLLGVFSLNTALILVGPLFAPATWRSPDGATALVADIGMQLLVSFALWRGALDRRLSPVIGTCAGLGLAFAGGYLTLLLTDFAGHPIPLNPYPLFLAAGTLSAGLTAYRTRVVQGVFAGIWTLLLGTALWSAGVMLLNYAFWGSPNAYMFWLRDGAVAAFQKSGQADFSLFLLQDIEGALFFHPILSAVLGIICGLTGACLGRLAASVFGPTEASSQIR